MIVLTSELTSKLKRLLLLQHDATVIAKFKSYWSDLQQNDAVLKEFIEGGFPTTGNVVLANMLYVLNNEVDDEIREILEVFGLPKSAISKGMMEDLKQVANHAGHVEHDGILAQNAPFAGLDPNWIELFLSYVVFQSFPEDIASFRNTPTELFIDDGQSFSLAIMGDWGTGPFNDYGFASPATLVGKAIKQLRPDITVHLGDVYYAGSEQQISEHLLLDFPTGLKANFTLNGNHEMFDGANGYFNTALSHPVFSVQNGTSYFAIRYADWIILGLDTAYYDSSLYYLKGAITDDDQLSFIKSLNIGANQKIILLTHHAGMSYDGKTLVAPLYHQVFTALGNRHPDYWYYGHIHNGIVYNDSSSQGAYQCPSGQSPKLRCVGHGSIPIGDAFGLRNAMNRSPSGIEYYARTPLPNPDSHPQLENRVLNGFAYLMLNNDQLTEQIYEVSPIDQAELVWEHSPTAKIKS